MISVMTVAHDRPEMLREAVASIRMQTRTDWEHLIYDSGSGPATVQAIDMITQEDDRVRRFRVDVNADQPAIGWNFMLGEVHGDYLCFLDDDNIKLPMFFERMAGILDAEPNIDVVTCGFFALRDDGSVQENHLNLRTDEILDERNAVDTGCFLIRRRAMDRIGRFPLDVRTNEDWEMVRRMRDALSMKHLPECLATWREHRGQRMKRADALGHARDSALIQRRRWIG